MNLENKEFIKSDLIKKISGTYWFPALDVPQQLDLQWILDMQKHGQIIPYLNKQIIGKIIIQRTPLFKCFFPEDILKILQEIFAKNFSECAGNPCNQGL